MLFCLSFCHFAYNKDGGESMKEEVYGYVRVSSKDQNEERQVIAMLNFGVCQSHIIVEKQSGKNFNRPKYQKLVEKMKNNDTLVCLLYTSPSPRDRTRSRMPSSA